jgi:hypothetical protein
MKRTAQVLVALILMALGGQAFAQVVVPLKRTPLSLQPTAAFWARRIVTFTSGRRPASVTKLPALSGTAYYATAALGGRSVTMLLDMAATPKLYVDAEGNGDLAAQEPFTSKTSNQESGGIMGALAGPSGSRGVFRFDPVAVTFKDPDAACEFAMEGSAAGGGRLYGILRPVAVRAGSAEIGGKMRQVEVLDATFDGRYDNTFSHPAADDSNGYPWDALFVDANGDGKILRASMTGGEVMPLPDLVSIGGSWYSIKVAPDGSSATFTAVQPPMGRLDVDTNQAELDLFSDSGFHHLARSKDGWQLPAGRYQTVNLQLVDSADGTPWTMTASFPTGPLRTFSVQADQTTSIKLGPPLVSNLTFAGSSTTQEINFALKGRADEQYAAGADRSGVTQPPPAFVILDKDGKRLASGIFAYG